MANNRRIAWIGFTSALFALTMLASASLANAATPQLFVSWKTSGSYIPSSYQGKALPTYGSQITASLMMLSNGKLIDLSGQTLYWYLNSTLLGGGAGAQTMTFPALGEPPSTMSLEVDLPNYNGAYLIQSVDIPMVQPEAVIDAPYPSGVFSQNPVPVQALPYFFNTGSSANLTYSWSVNDQSGSNSEDPEVAEIALPAGTTAGTSFAVSLNISSLNDSTQAAASNNLTYQPTL